LLGFQHGFSKIFKNFSDKLWCKNMSHLFPEDKVYKVSDNLKVRVNLYCEPFVDVVTVNGVPVLGHMELHKVCGSNWIDQFASGTCIISTPVTLNIYDKLKTYPELSHLLTLIEKFESVKLLLQNKCSTTTLFAPNDAAFESLAAEYGVTVDHLLNDMVTEEILKNHLLSKVLFSAAFKPGKFTLVANINNKALNVYKMIDSHNTLYVSSAETENSKVLVGDVLGKNGVIHIIDKVLQ
jgi:uncharacterized surface protein with fasciclin (FAS1) repeats